MDFSTGVGNQRQTDNVEPGMVALPPDFSHLDSIAFGIFNGSFDKQSMSM